MTSRRNFDLHTDIQLVNLLNPFHINHKNGTQSFEICWENCPIQIVINQNEIYGEIDLYRFT